jgi:hypothetical protein
MIHFVDVAGELREVGVGSLVGLLGEDEVAPSQLGAVIDGVRHHADSPRLVSPLNVAAMLRQGRAEGKLR